MKPEETKRRATASPIPGPAPTTAITGLFWGLCDMALVAWKEGDGGEGSCSKAGAEEKWGKG